MWNRLAALISLSCLASAGCGQVVGLGDERTYEPVECQHPVLWAKRFGDASAQLSADMVADGAGGVIIAGFFAGALELGGPPLISEGGTDIFLARLDGNGRELWSKRFGGIDNQTGVMTLTAVGDGIILSGEVRGTADFGGGPRTAQGFADGFIAKYDPAGNYLWSLTIAGPSLGHSELVTNVAVDGQGALYLSVVFTETVVFAGQTFTSRGLKDILLIKLEPNGKYVWSKHFGDVGDDAPNWISVDAGGRLLLGATSTGPIDIGQDVLPVTAGWDMLMGAYDPDTGDAEWTHRFGGPGDTNVMRMTVDRSSDDILVTGKLRLSGSVNLGAGDISANNGAYLGRLRGSDFTHVDSRSIENFESPNGLVLDPQGNLLVGGGFSGVLNFGSKPLSSDGGRDGVLMKLGPNLQDIWSLQLGSIGIDEIYGVAVDDASNAFALGHFSETATLTGCAELTSEGGTDLLLIKLAP